MNQIMTWNSDLSEKNEKNDSKSENSQHKREDFITIVKKITANSRQNQLENRKFHTPSSMIRQFSLLRSSYDSLNTTHIIVLIALFLYI